MLKEFFFIFFVLTCKLLFDFSWSLEIFVPRWQIGIKWLFFAFFKFSRKNILWKHFERMTSFIISQSEWRMPMPVGSEILKWDKKGLISCCCHITIRLKSGRNLLDHKILLYWITEPVKSLIKLLTFILSWSQNFMNASESKVDRLKNLPGVHKKRTL